jgi:hypothetical protein
MGFAPVDGRAVVADFAGGAIGLPPEKWSSLN